ncbi:MAG TPA: glutamate synthase large subunit, partial [Spirochaetia bacterium]|nr:glutamate synthase large subunit [Spirochaetia bacterium]
MSVYHSFRRTVAEPAGLYDPAFEHDSCGVGFVASIDGIPSHERIEQGIQILLNLEHRGATGGDEKTGDGAGMLIQMPHRFFTNHFSERLPQACTYGAGMIFLPKAKAEAKKAMSLTEKIIRKEGGNFLGFRDVPVDPSSLGEIARNSMPDIKQFFLTVEGKESELERRLYIIRKVLENAAREEGYSRDEYYIVSLSSRVMVYKGMLLAHQFKDFYPDLSDKEMESSLVVAHQRYSTNTFPSWPLAQPFRYIAHNGEINTLRRNINNMKARETTLKSPLFGEELEKLLPIVDEGGSDSAIFDNVFELLVQGGRSLEHAMMMMIPEAFGAAYHMSQDKRAFYEYHAAIMEPWDGPAAMVFTDGIRVGATLDRNGLRPGRYTITKSGMIVCASETGVLDIPPEDVLEKGKLSPGKMIVVDTMNKRILRDQEIKSNIARRKPYRRWLEKNKIELRGLLAAPSVSESWPENTLTLLKAFGYTLEDMKLIISGMAENGQEPLGSMGNDTPPAVLSERPQLMFNYFRQMFAQVTNPPIDPYRESLVMSLMSFVGKESNLLEESPEHCRQLKLAHPVLTNDDLRRLKESSLPDFQVSTIPILFDPTRGKGSLEQSLDALNREAERLIDEGSSLIILSDRGTDATHAPIPSLLAISSVHHHLVRAGKRHRAGLIIETGEAREVHHFATLVSFGASGINPYLVFEAMPEIKKRGYLSETTSLASAADNYITAVKKGLLKIMSKMGISTIRSYRGSQIFEAVGLSDDFVQRYFTGTTSRIGGVGLEKIEEDTIKRHQEAFAGITIASERLDSGGQYSYRRDSEKHLFSPSAITLLQKAVRSGDYSAYKKYSSLIQDRAKNLCTFRGLFGFKKTAPVPIEEVEPASEIVKRFVASAMSFGSLSKEAHETIALAMNRIGAASNSGEGGEDESRFIPLPNGDSLRSRVKQIASGRFGVSIDYLVHADELQIKIAQGAKPGEGGQIPGNKVDETIARVRHATPGVMLISPPPHHDIYSIEDLSELIFDLRCGNPDARISVKLVAEPGVGTIAAGVAKAKADMVLISGGDGGTGASPLSSIKYAGSYWEIGLSETNQVLVMNGLRDRIRVQVDGQIKTGRDVVIGALLGADEFGFGSAVLVSLGCVMMRKCHTNTCPVGVATQDPELRKRFAGKPEHLINLMFFVAEEVREYMAALGFKRFDDMVGRVDILETDAACAYYEKLGLDFSKIFYVPKTEKPRNAKPKKNQKREELAPLDSLIIEKARNAIEEAVPLQMSLPIRNSNRAVGASLSSEIAKRRNGSRLPDDTIDITFTGSAGQSFGAFLCSGVTMRLEGDANDYVGKGLSGGRLIIYPPKNSSFTPRWNIITGNVNLFGATGGEAYIAGMAGERFAVRNSGVTAVVEGVGDHGCEYMTGGCVVILGKTGVNFAAGMSGGVAYVFDENQLFDTFCNLEMVDVEPLTEKSDRDLLYRLIRNHVEFTGSAFGRQLIENWQ